MTQIDETIITPEIWQNLLSPISPTQPSGTPVHYDALHDGIQKARFEEDERLPQGVWQRQVKQADWNTVEKLCLQVLMTKSKDLHVVAWLMEAWLMRFQISGLTMGLRLYRELCQNFWDTLLPSLDQNMESRLAPLNWINEKLRERLIFVPIGMTHDKNVPILFYKDWIVASTPTGAPQSQSSMPATMTIAQFKALQSQVPTDFCQQFTLQIESALAEVDGLENLMLMKNLDAPHPLSALSQDLKKIALLCSASAPTAQISVPVVDSVNENTSTDQSHDVHPPTDIIHSDLTHAPAQLLKLRSHAYDLLQQAADILSTVEPHSPTPYLIKRAIAWGQMPLSQVMHEMVQDEGTFKQIQDFLKMDLPPSKF